MKEQFLTQLEVWGEQLLLSLLIIVLFWVLIKLTRQAIQRLARRFRLDPHLAHFMIKTARVILLVLGLVTVLGTLGVNVTAVVASLGLTGFALGFALKDTIANLLAGILILLYRPFHIGESIRIAGFEGRVVCVDLRYTELFYQGNRILIPNSRLFTDPIHVLPAVTREEQPD